MNQQEDGEQAAGQEGEDGENNTGGDDTNMNAGDADDEDYEEGQSEVKAGFDFAQNQVLVELLPLLGNVPMVFFLPSGTDQE